MTRHPFTPDEDAVLLAGYARRPLTDLAAELGRSYGSVQQRVFLLQRRGRLDPQTRFYHRPWTLEEDAELRGLVGWYSLPEVARRLGRSVNAVDVRCQRLGLSHRFRWLTARAVGALFGVDAKTVGIWIAKGWLPARRSTFGAGGGHYARKWQIDGEGVREFIRQYPSYYERRRITDPYWRKLADEAHRAVAPHVTVAQAATILRVNPRTVVRHLQRGWLPAVTESWSGGFRYLIPRAALADFQRRRPRCEGLQYVKGRCGALPRNTAARERMAS